MYVVVALRERAAARDVPAPQITVIGRESRVGRGLAYGRPAAHHRLNSPAGKMSVSAEDPDGFLNWSAVRGEALGPGDFALRSQFGDYLEETFAELVATGEVAFVRGEALDVRTESAGVGVEVAPDGPGSGHELIRADLAVLALGNPPPVSWASGAAVQIDDPWAAGALDAVPDDARVLLVGTGLTMVDVATTLGRRSPGITMTATSRHLLLPGVHPATPATPGPGLPAHAERLGALVHALGAQLRDAADEGRPWQGVIDGMRPRLMEHWTTLDLAERRRFVEHLARRWDVHRHRMAQSVYDEFRGLMDAGRLVITDDALTADHEVVVFCTGPAAVTTPGWSPLVDRLIERGQMTPEPLGLGLDAEHDGAVRDTSGVADERLLAIGHALRGALWETTAIGEIRIIANRVADRALDTLEARGTAATPAR